MLKAELIDQALTLPRAQRAEVALRPISSLDGPAEQDVEVAWGTEVGARMRELAEGREPLEDWDVVLARLKAGLRSSGAAQPSASFSSAKK